MGEKKTEKQVREEAQKLARKIGDEEWKKGETKHALEAYEASDITATELLEKAEKLLEAAEIILEWDKAQCTALQLPSAGHDSRITYYAGCDKCVRCKAWKDVTQQYSKRIKEFLGWGEWDEEKMNFYIHPQNDAFRAAAVACFKVIKRMLPEEKE